MLISRIRIKKWRFPIIILVVLVLIAAYFLVYKHKSGDQKAWYYQLSGAYSFQIPTSFGYDDTSLQGTVVVFGNGVNVKADSEANLYASNTITLAAGQIFNSNSSLFHRFVDNELDQSLQNSKHVFTKSYTEVNGVEAVKVNITQPYSLIQYYINYPQVVAISAHEQTPYFNTILNSINRTKKSLSYQDLLAVQRLNNFSIDALQKQKLLDLYIFTDKTIHKTIQSNKFAESLLNVSSKLTNSAASYNGYKLNENGSVVFQCTFVLKDKTRLGGVMTFTKQKDTWQVSGVSLQNTESTQ